MLRNTAISTFSFFYALGNTPAVNLTQDIPPEQTNINILLAGCGDARSILHTIFNERGHRSLDFTCCDIEPSILARNVLLFSFLLEGNAEIDRQAIWDIYFHTAFQKPSSDLLETQVGRLVQYAESMQSWKESPYGRVITFCDHQTLRRVCNTWKLHTTKGLTEVERSCRKKEISKSLERAKDIRKQFLGNRTTLSGLRSAAPVSVRAIAELPKLHSEFWTKGNLDAKLKELQSNPTFFLSRDRILTLHYGTDPLLGFHLATAFTPLKSTSPLKTSSHVPSHLPPVVKAAQTEFFAWLDAFITYQKQKLQIRCFVGDALAFGHTLQQIHAQPDQTTGHWHRDGWSFEPLELDEDQYGGLPSSPTRFSAIDVSNLTDHLGSLNIIVALAPLLLNSSTSTLYTEILVSSKAGSDERMRDFLCGDSASVSLLLGLANVETWTNSTCISDAEEMAMDMILKETKMGFAGDSTQIRTRLCWRRLDQVACDGYGLSLGPSDLAAILMSVYRRMFRHEDVSALMGDLGKHGVDHVSNPYYNRASFVALLKHIKGQVETDWSTFFAKLFYHIENDRSSMIGMNSYQELCLHLHLQGIFSVDTLSHNPTKFLKVNAPDRLRKEVNLPNVLAITVQVPPSAIKYVGSVPAGQLGIPSLCCTMQNTTLGSGSWSNLFSVVQAGFGVAQASISKDAGISDSFSVKESKADWTGKTPLTVSFYVPTWMLLQARTGTKLSVGFQTNAYAVMKHVSKLGAGLALYTTELENEGNVFISRFLPNVQAYPCVSAMSISESTPMSQVIKVQATLNDTNVMIERLVTRVSVSGSQAKELADRESRVTVSQVSPTVIAMTIGKQAPSRVVFPRPISSSRSKLRIARKSLYVEILAPFMSPLHDDFPQEHTFPASVRRGSAETNVVCWHMPYVNLDALPQVDFNASPSPDWMNTHTSLMFSAQERTERDAALEGASSTQSSSRSRVDFKDGLLSLFGHVAGVGRPGIDKAHAFGLHREDAGGVRVLIFVSKPLLDLSNRTVILDAAVIVLSPAFVDDPIFQRVITSLQTSGKLCIINTTESELQTWEAILPVFAERCRTWEHKERTCEYLKSGQMPCSNGSKDVTAPLCSCGIGSVPKEFVPQVKIPQLDLLLRKYAVRIAISPVFSVSYIEPGFSFATPPASKSMGTSKPVTQQNATAKIDVCAACGKKQAAAVSGVAKPLSQCARCRSVSYCSQECQRKDWKARHKSVCVVKSEHTD